MASPPPELISALKRFQSVRYADVAGAAYAIVEWLHLFPEEVEFVWKTHWSRVKILYLLSRYVPVLDITLVILLNLSSGFSKESCVHLFHGEVWTTVLGITISEGIFVMRTLALYEHSNMIKICVGFTAGLYAAGMITFTVIFLRAVSWPDLSREGVYGCLPSAGSGGHIIAFDWVSIAAFECALIILTIWRGRGFYTGRWTNIGKITRVVYRDSLLFFSLITLASLANVVVFLVSPTALASLLEIPVRVAHSSLTCRVLLNLRAAAVDPPGRSDETNPTFTMQLWARNRARTTTVHPTSGVEFQPFQTATATFASVA